jgi:tRNA pseudouridine55 synthase
MTSTEGLLLVDKPSGMTSHDVVAIARRALRTRRIGHTGTLDPFATGLLVLLVGRATRLAQYMQDEPKVYDATIQFGAETTTDDLTGDVTRVADFPAPEAVDDAIRSLTGRILQRPPDYSAKKVGGRRAYVAARSGAPVALESVSVVVEQWIVRDRSASCLDVTIRCGGGTYVRALARDLGRASGSAAHLTSLRRTRSGVFDVGAAVFVQDLADGKLPIFTSLRSVVRHLPAQSLSEVERRRVDHGNIVPAQVDAPIVALVDGDGSLIAIAERDGTTLRPRVVLHDG